jgi:hypothetical protein
MEIKKIGVSHSRRGTLKLELKKKWTFFPAGGHSKTRIKKKIGPSPAKGGSPKNMEIKKFGPSRQISKNGLTTAGGQPKIYRKNIRKSR